MRIGVLGCGPSGLLAAHMIRELGHQTLILSDKTPSYIAGAQYLHAPVPGIHDPDVTAPDTLIEVQKRGTREGYATKVYGRPDAPVSWDRYGENSYPAWNMRNVYKRLWDEYESHVVDLHLTPAIVRQLVSERPYGADAWVSTVPLNALCKRNRGDADDHIFVSQKVHVVQKEDYAPGAPSFITYNGMDSPGWYRRSVIFGTEALEWSGQGRKPPIDGLVTIRKPVRTTCDCWEKELFRQGRYGAWHKETLTNHVMNNVAQWIKDREMTGART